jgi:hydrogenase-4 component B
MIWEANVLAADEIGGSAFSVLPLLAVVIPAAAAVLVVAVGDRNEKLRNVTALMAAIACLGVVLVIGIQAMGGTTVYFDLNIVKLGGAFSLRLAVDPLAAFFALVASVLWVAAMAHSSAYMHHEQKRTRFFAAMMITEGAILGTFMAHDFLGLFIFFEIMGLAAYLLVVHTETDKARAAATKYLYMAIIGGLTLLMGILLYLGYSGTIDFTPAVEGGFLNGPFQAISLACMIAGFGVKAGIVPLHVWLPDAHPVAPSPASALLSGVVIKAGAYGIIRTVTVFFHAPPVDAQSLGFVLIWIAISTAFIGMILAVRQSDLKRTLAYSSISQMGFLLLGVGCLGYLGGEGSIGLAGSLYHIINHAFFKGCLFLVAGSVLYCAHETNMLRLGGLWRRMPITTLTWCVAVLGLMGIPLFNGFVSKTILHHAVVEAEHLAAMVGSGHAAWLQAAEILYTAIAAGTVLYAVKMSYYVFFRSPPQETSRGLQKVHEAPRWMLGGTGMLAIGVLALGLAPGAVLRHLIVPVAGMFSGLDPHRIAHLYELEVYSWYSIKDIILPLALGAGLFAVVVAWSRFRDKEEKSDPFCFRLPGWLSVDRLYVRAACGLVHVCLRSEPFFNDTKQALLRVVNSCNAVVSRVARQTMLPLTRRYAGDIVLGALIIAVFLGVLLALTIV